MNDDSVHAVTGATDSQLTPPKPSRPPAWRLVVAIALPLIAVIVIAVLAQKVRSDSAADPNAPLAVPVVLQPGSTLPACAALDAALPETLDGRARRTLVAPEPGVAAWGDPAVVMRCGISSPAELTCSAALTVYNGVAWLPITTSGSTTYIAVDRASRIALTVDDSVGVGVVQALSNAIVSVLPAGPVCTDGVVSPVEAP